MDQILKHGKVERAYLGILPQDVTQAIAKAFNTSESKGALVGDVTANSPASRANLKNGDIILEGQRAANRRCQSVAIEDRHDGAQCQGES